MAQEWSHSFQSSSIYLKFSFSSSYPDMSCFFFEKVIGICAVLLPGLMFFKQNEIMASYKGFLF